MKKKLIKLLSWIVVLSVIIVTLNIQVSTKQGVNYKVSTLKIPLYLKILDFFDRHYNYKILVKEITIGANTEEQRVFSIFEWTYNHIKPQPERLPVVDDHVWHIIVRGYGVDDQSSDVFTTLCNYAGIDAFFSWIKGENAVSSIPLSLVKIDGRWRVFDPYNGVYFKNNKKGLADIAEIAKGDWLTESIDNSGKPNIDYAQYLKNIQPINSVGLIRSNTQSPLNRLRYEIEKRMR